MFGSLVGINTPELPSISQNFWINSTPLKIKELLASQKVVLIDFWTYSCVNCLRTLPFIKVWHQKYAQDGLVIIGVHTPEFEFERNKKNVVCFIKKEKITYPVVLDNENRIWDVFTNSFWPRKFLIDNKGKIRYDHAGEGAYEETEAKIQELLAESNSRFKPSKIVSEVISRPGGVCYPMTPELYAGYKRGILANREGYRENKVAIYQDPPYRQDGAIHLKGAWIAKEEYLQHGRNISKPEDFLEIKWKGLECNAVVHSSDGKPFDLYLEQEGQSIPKNEAASDVKYDLKGRSFILVSEPRMYRLINSQKFGEHRLRLVPLASQFQIYAFTFGGCLE